MSRPHHGTFTVRTSTGKSKDAHVYHTGEMWMVRLKYRGKASDFPWSLCKSWGWEFTAQHAPTPPAPRVKRG